jgi:hypothetical protein
MDSHNDSLEIFLVQFGFEGFQETHSFFEVPFCYDFAEELDLLGIHFKRNLNAHTVTLDYFYKWSNDSMYPLSFK